MAPAVDERLLSQRGELWLCLAWVVFWVVVHFAASVPSGALERVIANDNEAKVSGHRQRPAYLRRLCRSQIYCVLSLVGACRLMLRWRRAPEDLLYDFTWDHQVLFSMALGHWAVSLWEDFKTSSFLAGGLDSKALPGIRDPSMILLQGFLLHHACAAASYFALLRLHRLACLGTLGLLFELPVLLLNRRDLARILGRQTGWSRWLSDRSAVREHWRFTYIFFLLGRGGPVAIYVYSLLWFQDQLAALELGDTLLYHGIAVFFAVLNYGFLSVLDAWSRADAAAAALPEPMEEDGDSIETGATAPEEPEAPALYEIDQEVLASKADSNLLWLAIEGVVYDLTAWQHEHPGGSEVLHQCSGQDATAEFYKACPAAQSPSNLAAMARYQVGALRLPPREYRIFEHPVEEREMRRLLMAAVPSILCGLVALRAFFETARPVELGDRGSVWKKQEAVEASVGTFALPGLMVATGAGAFALLLPMRRRLGPASVASWRAHVIALCLVGVCVALPSAAFSAWEPLGPAGPQGLELLAAVLLLLEILLAPAMTPPVLPVLLCLLSWYDRGLQSAHFFHEGVYLPWRRCAIGASGLILMTRLADDRSACVRKGLALVALYAPAGLGAYLLLQPSAFAELQRLFASPVKVTGLLVLAALASILAWSALLDMAVRCSSRFATRCAALTCALLNAACYGLSSWRWLTAVGMALHFLELGRHHRTRLDQIAAANRFSELPWHFLGAQALWDTSRVSVLGYIWRATVCNLQNVVTAIMPDELRVYACEVPVPHYGDKVAMGLAAQYIPPKARSKDRRKPNFFVCNVGQILESCMTDMQHTMNTLVDVWGEFHDPTLPGLCANVVMVFPSSDQGLAKEINLSVWESGKDAFDWYVKSKGHKKALMEHTSGILRTFGNLLASLEPAEPIKYEDRCRRCGRTVEAAPGETAPSACLVCGSSTFRYNLF